MGLERLDSLLAGQRTALIERTVALVYDRLPQLARRYGEQGREHCERDTAFHLDFLAEAARSSNSALFVDYLAWAKVMLARRGIPFADLAANLECLYEALEGRLPLEVQRQVQATLRAGLDRLPEMPSELSVGIGDDEPLGPLARDYLSALLSTDRHRAAALVLAAVEAGTSVRDVYLHVFQRAQREIGSLWQMNEISVAHEHYCTAGTQMIMSLLYPRIFTGRDSGRAMVMACVSGELHELGARMVADFFEMEAWNTIYLGANTPVAGVVQTVGERRAQLVGISATLTTHVGRVVELVRALRADLHGREAKILVGGHPFNVSPSLWREVGADGCGADAAAAVRVGEHLLGGKVSR